MKEWMWLFYLLAGMLSAWIIMSAWFWKLLWHILVASFEWTCNKIVHGSIQETWRDEEEVSRYVKPAKTHREYIPLEPKAIKPQKPPKPQRQEMPEDLSTMPREQLAELLRKSDVSLIQKES